MADYSVLLKTLDCKIKEKDTGDISEVYFNYIIDDGEVQRFPLSGNHSMKEGNVWNIDLHLSFNNKIIIVLVESNSLSDDKDLGIITINNSLLGNKRSFTNKNNNYNYELSYYLVPLYFVELANLECIKNAAIEGSHSGIYFKCKLDDGEELRYPTSGNYLIKQGECCYVGLNLQFSNKVFISLMEGSLLNDKNLGMIQLNGTILNGFQHFTNENADWDYKIIYFRLNRSIIQKKEIEKHEYILQ